MYGDTTEKNYEKAKTNNVLNSAVLVLTSFLLASPKTFFK